MRVKFKENCLKQDKITYDHGKIVKIYEYLVQLVFLKIVILISYLFFNGTEIITF